LPSIYRHARGLSCDLKVVVDGMFTHGLDIELSVGLLPHFNFSAFRILPTIPHPFPHFSIPHFTFRIPHSAIPHFTNDLRRGTSTSTSTATTTTVMRTTTICPNTTRQVISSSCSSRGDFAIANSGRINDSASYACCKLHCGPQIFILFMDATTAITLNHNFTIGYLQQRIMYN